MVASFCRRDEGRKDDESGGGNSVSSAVASLRDFFRLAIRSSPSSGLTIRSSSDGDHVASSDGVQTASSSKNWGLYGSLVKSFGLGWYSSLIRLSLLSVASFLELPCCAGLTSGCMVVSQGRSADRSHAYPTVIPVTVSAGG